MKLTYKFPIGTFAILAFTSMAQAQIPDLVNAFDAGGRSFGMGGALHGTDPSSLSAFYNPASLGYITQGEVDLALHNLNSSSSAVNGSRSNLSSSTRGLSGKRAVTDVGIAVPIKPLLGKGNASIALNYNIGGFVNDRATSRTGAITDGPINIADYALHRALRTDFVTLAYGQSTSNKSFSFGLGAVYAENHLIYDESGTGTDGSGNPIAFNASSLDTHSHGIGAIFGLQFIAPFDPNFSLGVSYRTPISLSGSGPSDLYNKIPGRALVDASYRIGTKGSDYAILAAQYQYFSGGDSSLAFDRSNQSVYGIGLEYDHVISNYRVPLRLGYETASSGGYGFSARNALTYGIGVRPVNSHFSLDLNFTTADSGGKDVGISAGYRFGK